MISKRQKPQPPSDDAIKHAYKLYLSKEFTLNQITRQTKVSSFWIYKFHKSRLIDAQKQQISMDFN